MLEAQESVQSTPAELISPIDPVERQYSRLKKAYPNIEDDRVLRNWALERVAFRNRTQELLGKANVDPLTGLPNRTAGEEKLARAMSRVMMRRRLGENDDTDKSVAFLLLDGDRFKDVNDTGTHSVGDAFIQRFGSILQDSINLEDFVFRLGGDEFGIILENVTEEQALNIADRVREAVKSDLLPEMRDAFPERKEPFTTSIGVSLFNRSWPVSLSELMHEADIAQYNSKNREDGHGDKVTMYKEDMTMGERKRDNQNG